MLCLRIIRRQQCYHLGLKTAAPKMLAGMPRSQQANGGRGLPPQQQNAPAAADQQGAQPVRINTHGVYARAIEDTDYIVPRGGYFFEVRSCAEADRKAQEQ